MKLGRIVQLGGSRPPVVGVVLLAEQQHRRRRVEQRLLASASQAISRRAGKSGTDGRAGVDDGVVALAALGSGRGEATSSDEPASGHQVDPSLRATSGRDVSRRRRVTLVASGRHRHHLVAVVVVIVVADAVGGDHRLEGRGQVSEADSSG